MLHFKQHIILLLYIDNIIIVAQLIDNINWFKCKFQKIFKIKNLKEIKRILNIRITCDRKVKTLCLNQSYYVNEMLDKLQMFVNKSNSIELSINEYDFFRFVKSKDERIE